MKKSPLVVMPRDHGRALDVVGEKITVLASRDDTQGYEIFLQQGPEGSGPPPHSHGWDEAFYVVRGHVDITIHETGAGRTVKAEPGMLVHLPAGTVYSFRFGPGGGEMVSMTGVASRAAQLVTAIDREVPPGPPDIPKLVAVAEQNGVRIAV
jgi:mannose-6-phosphate isomerase-like protein (cupin superfamily)